MFEFDQEGNLCEFRPVSPQETEEENKEEKVLIKEGEVSYPPEWGSE